MSLINILILVQLIFITFCPRSFSGIQFNATYSNSQITLCFSDRMFAVSTKCFGYVWYLSKISTFYSSPKSVIGTFSYFAAIWLYVMSYR